MINFKLKDKILFDDVYMEDVYDALKKAETLCNKSGYKGSIFTIFDDGTIRCFIGYAKYKPTIDINFNKGFDFNIRVDANEEFNWGDEYRKFLQNCIDASNLCEELNSILIPVEIAMFDSDRIK